MRRAFIAGLVALTLALPAPARALDAPTVGPPDPQAPGAASDRGVGLLPRLHYGLMGGGMVPAGPQGEDLRRGEHFGVQIFGESNLGIQIGGDVTYTRSHDPYRTRITEAGVFARLSPNPEDYSLYVQLGGGAYYLQYPTTPPSLPEQEALLRPGGSFGVGADIAHLGEFAFGGSVSYHGILVQRHRAVAFSTIRFQLTYQNLRF